MRTTRHRPLHRRRHRQYRPRPTRRHPRRQRQAGAGPPRRDFAGWPGTTAVQRKLWEIAEEYTPEERSADYSQAMMDLGATLCTRSTPACERCPVAADCRALATGLPGRLSRAGNRARPCRLRTPFRNGARRRGGHLAGETPGQGIWGGLWCFPEIADPAECTAWCLDRWSQTPAGSRNGPPSGTPSATTTWIFSR